MSDFAFDNTKPYLYVSWASHGEHGQLLARFRFPSESNSWRTPFEITLSGQVGGFKPTGYQGSTAPMYAIKVRADDVDFDDVERLVKLKRKFDKVVAERAATLPDRDVDGFGYWLALLNCAIFAWNIRDAHVFAHSDDHRCIPDTPHFGSLTKGGNLALVDMIEERAVVNFAKYV